MRGLFFTGMEIETERPVDCAFQIINSKGDAIDLISVELVGEIGISVYKTIRHEGVRLVNIYIVNEHLNNPIIDRIKKSFREGSEIIIHPINETELGPLVLKHLNELIREDILATLEGTD